LYYSRAKLDSVNCYWRERTMQAVGRSNPILGDAFVSIPARAQDSCPPDSAKKVALRGNLILRAAGER
jgi:hypothetical protein